jgi:hypothetical protein
MSSFKTLIPSEDLETFRGAIKGELLQPSDSGYDDARIVWNASIDVPD